jgi:glutaredoxin 3
MIEIYGKDSCPYTQAAVEAYRSRGGVYRNVKRDPDALAKMLEYSNGKRRVPVIVEDGRVTIGYGGT